MLLSYRHRPCQTAATTDVYGNGNPGSNGLPVISTGRPPYLGSVNPVPRLEVSNGPPSSAGLMIIGAARANLSITANVTLLVVPFATVPLPLDASGSGRLRVAIPNNAALCGGTVDFQAAFLDSGAADNVSHTSGLEWRVGSYEQ